MFSNHWQSTVRLTNDSTTNQSSSLLDICDICIYIIYYCLCDHLCLFMLCPPFVWRIYNKDRHLKITTQIAKFMGLTWDPPGADRAQVGPMLTPWTLLSGNHPHANRSYYHTCHPSMLAINLLLKPAWKHIIPRPSNTLVVFSHNETETNCQSFCERHAKLFILHGNYLYYHIT